MIWKNAFKYPILTVGIIMFIVFLMNPKTHEYWKKHTHRFIPNTCSAVVDRVKVKAPSEWEFDCPGTQLLLINIPIESELKGQKLKTLMYRSIANQYTQFAKFSNPETLENLKNLKLTLSHKYLDIETKTDGQAVVELLNKKTPDAIAQHLRLTVKVKEIFK